MIYDSRIKIVFCDLPKVGSTFLKQVLHILTGHRKVNNPYAIAGSDAHAIPFSTFNGLSFDSIIHIMHDATKFLFVRNPFTRILSGYIDKLFTNNIVFWGTTGTIIVKEQRPGASKESLRCGHDTTFTEFVKHIVNSEEYLTHRNPHWYPMYDACRPCNLNYDVIGNIETFQNDLDMFLKLRNFSSVVDISSMNSDNDNEAIELTVKRAFGATHHKRKCILRKDALGRAWTVLQIRGVISHAENIPKRFIGQMNNITEATFVDFIKRTVRHHPLSKEEKLQVRREAVVRAFRSLPSDVMKKFLNVYHPDFVLFGYPKNIEKEQPRFHKWNPFI